jgi:hypothetical protein
MNVKPIKFLAVQGAFALMLAFSPTANAQTVVQASISTSSAITVADGADMAFGEWFLAVGGAGGPFSLTLSTAGVITDDAGASSFAEEITPGAVVGTVTATTPTGVDGIVLQMTRDAIVPFADAGLTLENITYMTTTEAEDALDEATAVPVTVLVGGTPELVSFGADIAVSATPADGTHTASFTVSFAY